jgi:hypothetical protein
MAALGLAVLYEPWNSLREDFGGDPDRMMTEISIGKSPRTASLVFGGSKVSLDEIRDAAATTCANQPIQLLSAALGTRPTPGAVATRYAKRAPLRARATIYQGCLEGLSSSGW